MHSSIVLALATATVATAQVYGASNCDDIYNKCIQEYTSQGKSPFFPECNSRRAACAGGVVQPSSSSTSAPPAYTTTTPPVYTTTTTTTSSYPTTTSTSGKCQAVWDACISSYTSKGQSPFFPECNSRRAACEAGSSYSTGPVPTFPPPASTTTTASSYITTTTQSPVPTTSYSDKCQQVWDQCIQSYTSKGQSPFFPECNSRRAACQAGSPSTWSVITTTTTVSKPAVTTTTTTTVSKPAVTTSSTVSLPVYKPSTTTTAHIGTYTGGAAATQAPVLGLIAAAGAFALL